MISRDRHLWWPSALVGVIMCMRHVVCTYGHARQSTVIESLVPLIVCAYAFDKKAAETLVNRLSTSKL